VIADFEDPWESRKGLGDGFRIEARIVIHETDPNSLKVASGSLFRHEEGWHVYRVRGGKVELVPVEVGESNGTETVIRSGLEEADLVALYPTEQIVAGVRVLENLKTEGIRR
jgi:HlyD family secretion protein